MIPDNIKEKINSKYPDTDDFTNCQERRAAIYGYQLAQEELNKKDERIKELEYLLEKATNGEKLTIVKDKEQPGVYTAIIAPDKNINH